MRALQRVQLPKVLGARRTKALLELIDHAVALAHLVVAAVRVRTQGAPLLHQQLPPEPRDQADLSLAREQLIVSEATFEQRILLAQQARR